MLRARANTPRRSAMSKWLATTLGIAAVAIPAAVFLLPVVREYSLRDALVLEGVCTSDHLGGRRRDRYFVVVRNSGLLDLSRMRISVWYPHPDRAAIDSSVGDIDVTPHNHPSVTPAGEYSATIALAESLPWSDKVTVHVGDVIENERTGATMPALRVDVVADKARSKSVHGWTCVPATK
jgi:hypothetical protein